MTATARKIIDGLTRERLLEFANGQDDPDARGALLDLAGKWKHNWIPLDEIAAAIKAKRMKGDGIRRPGAPSGVVARPAGKSRLDPKGAAKHAGIVNGARSKAKPSPRARIGNTREGVYQASEASSAARDARHAQIRSEIKVKKEIRDGHVHFVASHDNGLDKVSVAHPQAGGVTDALHRKQVRDSLHMRIVSDQPGRRPASGPDAPTSEMKDAAQAAAGRGVPAKPVTTAVPVDNLKQYPDSELRNWLKRGDAGMKERAQAELNRRHAENAPSAPKRDLKETHPVGMQVDARQPGIDRVTPGIVTAHKPDGMLEVGYHDHRGNVARGTFNPAHVTPSHRAERVDIGTAGASSGIGALNADLPKGYRITRDARMGPALEHNGKIIRTTSAGHEQGLVQYAKDHAAGDTSAHPRTVQDEINAQKAGHAIGDRVESEYGPGVVTHVSDRSVSYKLDKSGEVLNVQRGTPGYDRIKKAGPGKAEAAAEPAAPAATPAAPAKKPRKPSALHQEYRDRRAEQDRRFEAHTGGGISAQDTHTQEYKDYFGVGDHSTSPQEQRLTYKSFLEERRQGKEYERRQQQAYDAGVKLGAAHGEQTDSSAHEGEYQHHSAGHDGEMFGQGYSDGIQTGAARAEQRQKDNAQKMAELHYGRARDVAEGTSKAAETAAGHVAAGRAHVEAAKAALAAGRRQEAQHHISKAQEHKGHVDRLDAAAAAPASDARRFGEAANSGQRANIGEAQAQARQAAQGPPKQGEMFGGHGEHQADIFDQPAEAPASGGDASRTAGITVEHSGDGTLVHGTERSDTETTAALKAQGFKWSRNLNAWYLPRTWGESTRDTRVRGLEARLGDKITVQRGDLAKSTSGADERAQRIARNAELEQKHTDRAGKLDAEAQRRFDAADRATAGIPFGQPILVGHHSQRRHENAIAKSHANMGAGVQAHGEANRARDLATSAAARNRLEEDPKFLARRLDRNQAEHRKVLRTLERANPADDHTKSLEAYRRELEGKIGADQAAMTAAGGGQHSKATITAGDIITYRGSHHIVHRTNAKTVTVPSQHERLAEAGYTDTIPYSQISKHHRLEDAKPASLRLLLDKPGTPEAIKSRIRAILRDKGESTA